MIEGKQSCPVLVRNVAWLADAVIELTVEHADGELLPAWRPGAHIDIVLPSGQSRQYSLCGEPSNRRSYKIAVLKDANGRGGSIELHDTQLIGRVLELRGPRNHFALVPASAYRFVAGGIGVTPIVPMVAAVAAQGLDWKLLYGARSCSGMAYRSILELYGDRVAFVPEDELGHPDIRGLLTDAPTGAAIYCCGPEGMIRAIETCCMELGRSADLHLERFSPAIKDPAQDSTLNAPGAFEVELRRTGATIVVPPDGTILDSARNAGVQVPSSCGVGVCGACEVTLLDGVPDHRDSILSAQERAEGKTMMICVSRALSKRLVLDL